MEIATSHHSPNCKILRIKTYPHLRKFITAFYKATEEGAIRVDRHTSLGITMSNVLLSKEKLRSDRMDRFTDELMLQLSARLSRFSLRPRIVHQFNVEMDRIFKDHLIEWIKSQTTTGTISVSEAIRNFMRQYKITESEYSFDNMYRHYTRWNNDEYYRKRKSA